MKRAGEHDDDCQQPNSRQRLEPMILTPPPAQLQRFLALPGQPFPPLFQPVAGLFRQEQLGNLPSPATPAYAMQQAPTLRHFPQASFGLANWSSYAAAQQAFTRSLQQPAPVSNPPQAPPPGASALSTQLRALQHRLVTRAIEVPKAQGQEEQPLDSDEQLAPGVYARSAPDDCHILLGAPLSHVYKLLERIFAFEQVPGWLTWRRREPLNPDEWAYIKATLTHARLAPALQGQRVLKPLPDHHLPGQLGPRAGNGALLQGPRISLKGLPHNIGRQFFSNFIKNDPSGFLWADGVKGMEPEAQKSFVDSCRSSLGPAASTTGPGAGAGAGGTRAGAGNGL